MKIRKEIEKITEGKNDIYIGVNRADIKIEQSTTYISVIEDENMLQIITDNTDYTIRKDNINTHYSNDDTVTVEFNRYEKVVIRAIG